MLVRESLYNFKRGEDAIQSSGLGLKHKIEEWFYNYKIKQYVINDDFTIYLKRGLLLTHTDLIEFPYFIKFKYVKGNFAIQYNKLKTLLGCPISVANDFRCNNNMLTSLEGCPKYVGGDFYCCENVSNFTEEYVRSLCEVKGEVLC